MLLLVPKARNPRALVLFHLAIDALNFTFTANKTGGVASPLGFLPLAGLDLMPACVALSILFTVFSLG